MVLDPRLDAGLFACFAHGRDFGLFTGVDHSLGQLPTALWPD
jgi:hypothetical protein